MLVLKLRCVYLKSFEEDDSAVGSVYGRLVNGSEFEFLQSLERSEKEDIVIVI